MKIREFVPGDRAAFLEMSNDFYHSGAAASPIPSEYAEKTFDEIIQKNPDIHGLMLEEQGRPAGYALYFTHWSCEVGGRVIFLDELYVSPTCRGRGYAADTLLKIEELYPDAAAFRLEVCMSNQKAISLYERFGYEFLDYHQMRKVRP